MVIDLKEVKEARQTLKQINEAQSGFKDNINKQIKDVEDKFYKQKRALEDKEYKEVSELNKTKNKINGNYERKKENYLSVMSEFDEVLEFIRINKRNEKARKPKVYSGYRDKRRTHKPIDVLENDDLKKIFVYITNNRKPKNKVDLCIIGDTIFTEKLLDFPYTYGLDANTENANIRAFIRSFEDEDKAKEYIKRNKHKLLLEFRKEHSKIEERYLKTLAEIKDNKEWEIAYWESRKYYYEECYYRGTETEEYKDVLKKLKELKNK